MSQNIAGNERGTEFIRKKEEKITKISDLRRRENDE